MSDFSFVTYLIYLSNFFFWCFSFGSCHVIFTIRKSHKNPIAHIWCIFIMFLGAHAHTRKKIEREKSIGAVWTPKLLTRSIFRYKLNDIYPRIHAPHITDQNILCRKFVCVFLFSFLAKLITDGFGFFHSWYICVSRQLSMHGFLPLFRLRS